MNQFVCVGLVVRVINAEAKRLRFESTVMWSLKFIYPTTKIKILDLDPFLSMQMNRILWK